MDFAEVTLAGAKAIHVNLAEQASIDAAVDRVRRTGGRAVVVRRGRRRHAGHREDQLHRPPAPDRPADRRRACSAAAAPSASSRRPPVWAGRRNLPQLQGVPGHPDFDERGRPGSRPTARPTTCRPSRPSAPTWPARRSPSSSRASGSTPSAPGPPTRPLAQANKEHVAGLRRRLPRRGRASRRPRRWSRPTRWSSCAATPPPPSTGSPWSPTPATSSSGITGSFPEATSIANFLLRPVLTLPGRGRRSPAPVRPAVGG